MRKDHANRLSLAKACPVHHEGSRWPVAGLLAGFLLVLLASSGAWADNPVSGFAIEPITAYNLVVDSNMETPAGRSPTAAYLGIRFCNNGTSDLHNVIVYIGTFESNAPGIYPSTVTNKPGPNPDGGFSLTHEYGSASSPAQDARRVIGTISAGVCRVEYWLVSYPLLDTNGAALHGPSVKPDDDLVLYYDIWGVADRDGTIVTADVTRKVTLRNEITAMANKIIPNTANKVPQLYLDLMQQYVPTWTNTPYDGTVGTRIFVEGYWYDLGVIGFGFDNDNDLVPDHNAWMQPVGDPSVFDPACFRLVRTRAMVVVKLVPSGELVYIVDDQLYFEHVPENSGAIGLVLYEFMPLKANCVSSLTPYQEVASGYDNEKFNADYGRGMGLRSDTSTVEIAKGASTPTVIPGETFEYYVSYSNRGNHTVGDITIGSAPLVITDHVPDGTEYVAGSATNNNTLPTNLYGYVVFYSTDNGLNWTTVEPPAADVTDIQWWLTGPLETNAGGQITFTVVVDEPFTQNVTFIENRACIAIDDMDPITCDTNYTEVMGSNALGDTVWADDGTGGGLAGNGVQDGAEWGITNITVWLYRDVNTNHVVDAGDELIRTNSTGAAGYYLFTNLLDGAYIAVVDWLDPELPYGYTLTTPETHWADLDIARTNTNSVVYLDADFGFGPALVLDKARLGTNVVYEGQQVTFQLSVTNNLEGAGTGVGTPMMYMAWATNYDDLNSEIGNKAWGTITNAWDPPYPDGAGAIGPFDNAGEQLALTDFKVGYHKGSITNVELVFPYWIVGTFGSKDTVDIHIYDRLAGTPIWSTNGIVCLTQFTNDELVLDVTSATNWTWADFNTNTWSIVAVCQKQANPVVEWHVDCFGFRLWSDNTGGARVATTTLDPVPLTDRYPTSLLSYVSAEPMPQSVVTSGVNGLIFWDNIGPIDPGGTSVVYVTFEVLEPPSNQITTVTNYAMVTNATFINHVPANTATDQAPVEIHPAGMIGDFVWRDINGDGVQDGGDETGIWGVYLTCTPPTNINLGNGYGAAITNVTSTNGYYYFKSLPATGVYTVRVLTATLPGGVGTNTFDEDGVRDNITRVYINVYTNGTNNTHLTTDYGYQISGMIEGTIWHDFNRNGASTPDPGEDWLTNVTVYLCSGSTPCGAGGAVATNYTDTNGYFQFVGYTGTWTVSVNTNTGPLGTGTWYRSFDTDGLSTTNYVVVNVPPGGVDRADFSYYRIGAYAIGDMVFFDWDGDGVQDANEEGIPDITVWLYEDVDHDGVVDSGIDAMIGSDSTSSTGWYLYPNLPTGSYLVIVNEADTDFPSNHICTADPDPTKDGRSILTLTNADNLLQDFGYQPAYARGAIGDWVWYDGNGDGTQDVYELGIADITVDLYIDANNDGIYVLYATTNTDSIGWYIFTNLPDSIYSVRVDSVDPQMPSNDFGYVAQPTTVTNYSITITNSCTNLTADFGFVLPGVIGDTVYWDWNESGSQDWNEDGITGVTVDLYYDVNNNRVFDDGTDVFVDSGITGSNGLYLFVNLWPTNYIVVVDETSQPITNATLTADPDNDGLPCSDPSVTNCDAAYAYPLDYGEIFLGADFGYLPPGVIGDLVWVDQNDNGLRDSGELGIPFITIWLYTNGVPIATNETDFDGWYAFGNLMDGTFRVEVDTNDVDFPPDLYANYDYDGTFDSRTPGIIISNGTVTDVDGTPCTLCNTNIDFGYRYPGTNILSGTVGLDALPFDGNMNTTHTGYAANESPFPGVEVFLYVWDDGDGDNDGEVDEGEYVRVLSTKTDSVGDYVFTNLPFGDGDDNYIVSLAAPRPNLYLTTTNGSLSSPPALWITNFMDPLGYTRSAYQVLTIQSVSTNIDFAFTGKPYDFGDLPNSYKTQLQDIPAGAQNEVLVNTNLYLGATVDTEVNGQPTDDATGDGADEDGVTTAGVWQDGTNGAQVTVVVGKGSGWLAGFLDFNNDGDVSDVGEMFVSQAINATGTYSFTVNVPTNTINARTTTVLHARFRLFDEQPLVPALSFMASADNGEVEDYVWVLGVIADTVWEDSNSNEVWDVGEPLFTNMMVFVDQNTNGTWDAGEPHDITDSNGAYWIGGFPAGSYTVVVDTNDLPDTNYYATYDLDGGEDSLTLADVGWAEVKTNVDFAFRYPTPTYVVPVRFGGTVEAGQLVLEWETAAEIGTIGFNLLRRENAEGTRLEQVNDGLLPAVLAQQGGTYRYVDTSAQPGMTYLYQLNEIEYKGRANAHGPYEVAVPESDETLGREVRNKAAAREHFVRTPRVSASAQRRLAAAAQPVAPAAGGGAPPAEALKVQLSERGVYFVDAGTMAGLMGVTVRRVSAAISNYALRVTNRGLECGYLPTEGGLCLYGEEAGSMYTTNNVYALGAGGAKALVVREGTGPSPVSGGTFADTLHVEADKVPVTAPFDDPSEDYWFWNYLIADYPPLDAKDYAVYAQDVADDEDAQATLAVHLFGGTTIATGDEHRVAISLNGHPLGEIGWNGIERADFSATFSQSLLVDGANSVSVQALLNDHVPYSVVYVDSFDLTCQRRYEAVDNQLLVRADDNPVVTVEGFTAPDVRVLDVSNPRRPVVENAVTVDAFGGGWRASFVPAGPSVPYQLFVEGAAMAPGSIAADRPSDLRDTANAAEYVVITVPELAAEAATLAAYRSGKGLTSKVVLLDDIYDEFNYGLAEPPAIKSFLSYAAQYWTVPPRYVVLAGEGNYDYLNNTGAGGNLLPAMLASTPQGLYASDGWFADIDGDLVPDMAVGRLPVLTPAELSALVGRITGYESGEGGRWKQDIVLAADNPDNGGDFPVSSDSIGSLLPRDYALEKVYLSELGLGDARTQLIGAINKGAAFVNYFGHGGINLLAAEGLFTSGDAGALTNGNRLPVVVSLSCVVGQFALPGFDCLSETLLLSPGGAVAVWSPTGESYNHGAEILASGLYRTLFQGGEKVLGDAVVRTLGEFDQPWVYMLKIYNLLGDPAMDMQGAAFIRPVSTLQDWAQQQFTAGELADPAVSGFDADPDGDHVENLMEYAMGWNPHVADGDSGLLIKGPWEIYADPSGEAYIYYQRRKTAADLEFQLQASPDLLGWGPADAYVTGTVVTDDENGLTETVQVGLTIPPTEPRHLFIRLLVRQP
ncbi:MAG: hypothetical protein JXB04_02630 [Kiritimatiellae bacterium]|nr:hypothetical protein [Kiritimatiellia bacterium]